MLKYFATLPLGFLALACTLTGSDDDDDGGGGSASASGGSAQVSFGGATSTGGSSSPSNGGFTSTATGGSVSVGNSGNASTGQGGTPACAGLKLEPEALPAVLQIVLDNTTHDAYTYGLNRSLLQTTAPGQRFMMLMTDGGPTLALECMGGGLLTTPQPQQPIIDSIRAAQASHGIKSFLVGVPGTEDIGNQTRDDGRPWMSTAAVLGGTALPGCNVRGPSWCHIDLTQAADFSVALRQGLGFVTRQILSCEYEVPSEGLRGEPINQDQINVFLTPAAGSRGVVKRDQNSDCANGWQLQNGFVTLCPSTCDQLKSDSLATLEIEYGCDTIEVPIR